MEKNMKKNMRNFRILIAGGGLVLVLLLVLTIYLTTQNNTKAEFTPFEIEPRVDKILDTKIANSQSVGWIRVQGTNIDYPIIYETRQAYDTDIDYTWIVHRPSEGENRLAIYGHNLRNVSNEPVVGDDTFVRFEQLMSFVYEDFAQNNLYLQYSHDDVDEIYLIYAVGFVGDGENGSTTTSLGETSVYIENAIQNSLYRYDVDVNANDTLLSLITCTRYFGLDGEKQFRVDARKLREDEKVEKYAIQTTTNYDIIK